MLAGKWDVETDHLYDTMVGLPGVIYSAAGLHHFGKGYNYPSRVSGLAKEYAVWRYVQSKDFLYCVARDILMRTATN